MATSESMPSESAGYLIQSDYLDLPHHQATVDHSKRAGLLLDQTCLAFERYYSLMLVPEETLEAVLEANLPASAPLQSFQKFVKGMVDILRAVPRFQINGLSRAKSLRESQVGGNYEGFLYRMEQFGRNQLFLEQHREQYAEVTRKVESKS